MTMRVSRREWELRINSLAFFCEGVQPFFYTSIALLAKDLQ